MDPQHVHRVPDYTGATKEERVAARAADDRDLPRARLPLRVRRLRLHGRGRRLRARPRAGRAHVHRARARTRRRRPARRTKPSAPRSRTTSRSRPASTTPPCARCCASTRTSAGAREAREERAASSVPELERRQAVRSKSWPTRCSPRPTRKGIDLYTHRRARRDAARRSRARCSREYSRQPLPPQGHRRRRRQGPAHLRATPAQVPGLVREILHEVKATGVGDNKNILLELNIEQTRHNEIQMLGNGEWCVTLGGRDCSLQMHEQKLLEVSVTQEGARRRDRQARTPSRAATARPRRSRPTSDTLRRMEARGRALRPRREARLRVHVRVHRRGRAPLLHGGEHAHPGRAPRVGALLRAALHQPGDAERLLRRALAGRGDGADRQAQAPRCPSPTRVLREGAAVEARLNATDRSLIAARGRRHRVAGPIRSQGEIRDDQGISHQEPGHGPLHALPPGGRLRLEHRAAARDRQRPRARATSAAPRSCAAPRCAARTSRPTSSSTSGWCSWFLAERRVGQADHQVRRAVPDAGRPAQAGSARRIDLELRVPAARPSRARDARPRRQGRCDATRKVLELKETLLERPHPQLFEEPHYLSAWLSTAPTRLRRSTDGRVVWKKNPVRGARRDLPPAAHGRRSPARPRPT